MISSSLPSWFKSVSFASVTFEPFLGENAHNKLWLPPSPNSIYSNWFDSPPRSNTSLLPLLFRSNVPKTKRFPASRAPQVQMNKKAGNLIDIKLFPARECG